MHEEKKIIKTFLTGYEKKEDVNEETYYQKKLSVYSSPILTINVS